MTYLIYDHNCVTTLDVRDYLAMVLISRPKLRIPEFNMG